MKYEGTKFVWKQRIQSSILKPSDGICISVLNLAARYADPGLAVSALRILSARRSALTPFHYEALLAAYAGSNDLSTAFRTLVIMSKAGYQPTASHTRPLYQYLVRNKSLPDQAWKTLHELHDDGHDIPIAAVNVVIEACNTLGDSDKAVDIYKELHNVCVDGPNTDTFNVLFQNITRKADAKEVGMFIAGEMAALGIQPDALTYDRLIRICLNDEDYEDAFKYLEEMVSIKPEDGSGGWWMRRGTASSLVEKCIKAKDDRAWVILAEMEKRGMQTGRLRDWAEHWSDGNQLPNVIDESYGLRA